MGTIKYYYGLITLFDGDLRLCRQVSLNSLKVLKTVIPNALYKASPHIKGKIATAYSSI